MTVLKKVAGKQRNFQATTSLYSEHSLTIDRDANGVIQSIVVTDGITVKTMTFGWNANGRLMSISTVVTEP